MSKSENRFDTRAQLSPGIDYFSLPQLEKTGLVSPGTIARLPITLKILLENLLRHDTESYVEVDDVETVAKWNGAPVLHDKERAFMPARVLLQDFTGVPAIVDLAAMRSAMARRGGNPGVIDPLVPVDLVVDHSVQVDAFGNAQAYEQNIEREYERNHERYTLLRWAQQAFKGFRVVPPGMGIVHQINLEYLGRVVETRDGLAFPDTLVGTDSHTTMINGIGVLAWGVGGIEAEAVMLGQPLFLLSPVVVGVEFLNALQPGVTATDLVLTLTEKLRQHGVVNKFVEFCGAGLSSMSAPDRATLSNMSPEFGATSSLFPVDARTLEYLRESGRSEEQVQLVDRYTKSQGLFRTDELEMPTFSEMLQLDLAAVEPSVAGPRRPQDRVALPKVWDLFTAVFQPAADAEDTARLVDEGGNPAGVLGNPSPDPLATPDGKHDADQLRDGAVVIAAITSCTNTSNPSVMVGAGLLAKRALERGMTVPHWVKTSMAPGSRVVSDYLDRAELTPALNQLGFNVVGYGCTTCIGNSGPLPEDVSDRIQSDDLAVVAVLSGNRNFEGRIHPQVKASYLASPPLVVAYALAGTVKKDLTTEPLGQDREGKDVYLSELWPSSDEITAAIGVGVGRDLFADEYSRIFDGDENWRKLPAPEGAMFAWDSASTYVQEPPFFAENVDAHRNDIIDARVLVMVGDSITTDHISPAGSIFPSGPAAQYLREHGVELRDFNTFGARRGNHEVMMRGTFANIRLRNALADGKEGGYTKYFDTGEITSIYDAAMKYQESGTPLIVIAGKEYGSGSSRDWAAKGTALLGVRTVIAESFERIHRSNLVGMGILPLQFHPGETAEALGLKGDESYTISGVATAGPKEEMTVVAKSQSGESKTFVVTCRLDSDTDVSYFRAGGILPLVLNQLSS